MNIGLIGAGNMGRALALGLGRNLHVSDVLPERAAAIVDAVGGCAHETNLAVAKNSDLVILCHKPAQLPAVARELAATATPVVSLVGTVSISVLQAAFPDRPVFRLVPNVAAEVRGAVIGWCEPEGNPAELSAAAKSLFSEVGLVVPIKEKLLPALDVISGVGPAYVAMLVEAQVDVGVRLGLAADLVSRIVIETFRGTADLLAKHAGDTLAVRRLVTSPGGITARGVATLERHGLRAAFHDAADAALYVTIGRGDDPSPGSMPATNRGDMAL
jgi:pyrroline-5-carboxylate reductase